MSNIIETKKIECIVRKYYNSKAAWSCKLSDTITFRLWKVAKLLHVNLNSIQEYPIGSDVTWTTHSNLHSDIEYDGQMFLSITLECGDHILSIGENVYHLSKGFTVFFNPMVPHKLSLPPTSPASMRWVGLTFHFPLNEKIVTGEIPSKWVSDLNVKVMRYCEVTGNPVFDDS